MNKAIPPDAPAPSPGDGVGESKWRDCGPGLARINGCARTSWIVEPADGQMPFNPTARAASEAAYAADAVNFDNPENRKQSDLVEGMDCTRVVGRSWQCGRFGR